MSSIGNLLSVLLVVGAERRIVGNRLGPDAGGQGSGFPGPLGRGSRGLRPRRCRGAGRGGNRSPSPRRPRSRCRPGPAEAPPRLGRGPRLRRAARRLQEGNADLRQAARALGRLVLAVVPGWFPLVDKLRRVGEALCLRRLRLGLGKPSFARGRGGRRLLHPGGNVSQLRRGGVSDEAILLGGIDWLLL